MRTQRFLFLILVTTMVFWGCSRQSEEQNALEPTAEAGAGVQAVPGGPAAHEGLDAGLVEESAGQPAIVFAHTEFDFGEVEQGEDVEHVFTFRNTGNSDLIIERVRSG